MIIGVTGSLACGKTIVSGYFKKFGFEIVNADKIVHKLLDNKTRMVLRKIVISSSKKFDKLEHLIHPIVLKEIKEKIANSKKNNRNLIIDAPLLIETGLDKNIDFLVVVRAEKDIQIKRAVKTLGLTKVEAVKLIKRQMRLKEKIKRADFVVDNSGRLEQTKKQVKNIWEKIKTNKRKR